jgi:hypothetical protein
MPLAVEEFEKLGTPVAGGVSGPSRTDVQEESVAAEESEGRQKIWRWILAAVFAVLFIETLLGTRTARRYSTVEGGSIA